MCLTACLSFGRGSVAHAIAPDFAAFVVGADRIVHLDASQDGDSACSDDHKGMAHHHAACHGHKIGVPPADGEVIVIREPARAFTPTLPGLAPDARSDASTRPPKA
jgi:hypothetical protein